MDESVIKHLEQPQVGTLKLSEAMRIGARMRPKCTGDMFRDGRSCALGAAYEGYFGFPKRPDDGVWLLFELLDVFPYLRALDPLNSIGMQRNDQGWTREEVADWLEGKGY